MSRDGSVDHQALLDVRDGVGVITLNRPEAKNSWTRELQEVVFDRFDEASADPEVRAIVLTGSGEMFCPGADSSRMETASKTGIAGVPGTRPMTHPLSVPKPTIAAINGSCAGFGFVLTAMCDIRIAAREAKFTTSFARRGVAAEHTITYLLPRQIGLQRALDLLLTGRVFGAEEALDIGYLLKVVDRDKVLDAALEYAGELVRWCSPMAMSVIRRQVYEDLDHDFETARKNSVDNMVRYSKGPDFAEGVASFLERRPPQFPPLQP